MTDSVKARLTNDKSELLPSRKYATDSSKSRGFGMDLNGL